MIRDYWADEPRQDDDEDLDALLDEWEAEEEQEALDQENAEIDRRLAVDTFKFKKEHDRDPSPSELEGIALEMREQLLRDEPLDFRAAFDQHWKLQRREPWDMSKESDRVAYMNEQLAKAAEQPEPEPPSYEPLAAGASHGEVQDWYAKRFAEKEAE